MGGAGADRLEGGAGLDLASYTDAAVGVRADLTTPSQNTGDAKGDIYVGIEGLEGSGFGDTLGGDAAANLILGGGGNDQLFGRVGNDQLYGGEGDDTLSGGAGADRLTGGAGLDLASYAESRALRVDLAQPGLSTGEALGDQFEGIEGLVGGIGNDTLLGDGQANLLIGAGEQTSWTDAAATTRFGAVKAMIRSGAARATTGWRVARATTGWTAPGLTDVLRGRGK
jgi:Ca2+-binding RTX toxin-like protein